MTKVAAVPAPDLTAVLPGYDFADAFAGHAPSNGVAAPALAGRIMAAQPGWAAILLKTRNFLVRPFGLIHAAPKGKAIGFFPVVSEAEDRVILGFDDRHLDFRIVLDFTPAEAGLHRARLATAVRTHNWGGRAYLRLILPFHRLIVRVMLARGLEPRG